MSLTISIWSDIACPWCYVGKRRLESALEMLAEQGDGPQVSIVRRAFELDPRPRASDRTAYVQRLAGKYGTSLERAQEMLDTMTEAGRQEGLNLDFGKAVSANTFDAHRLIQWAGATDSDGSTDGAQERMEEALMQAHLEAGLDMGSHSDLLSVVATLGLDVAAATAVLAGDDFAEQVRRDEEEAYENGVSGVPFFLIGEYGIGGAQDAAALVKVIRKVQTEQAAPATAPGDEPFCTPDGC